MTMRVPFPPLSQCPYFSRYTDRDRALERTARAAVPHGSLMRVRCVEPFRLVS